MTRAAAPPPPQPPLPPELRSISSWPPPLPQLRDLKPRSRPGEFRGGDREQFQQGATDQNTTATPTSVARSHDRVWARSATTKDGRVPIEQVFLPIEGSLPVDGGGGAILRPIDIGPDGLPSGPGNRGLGGGSEHEIYKALGGGDSSGVDHRDRAIDGNRPEAGQTKVRGDPSAMAARAPWSRVIPAT